MRTPTPPVLSGIPLDTVQPGDLGVCRSKGLLAWLIRLGTWSRWNHVVIFEAIGADMFHTTVIQAEAKGVERAWLDHVAEGGEVKILACPEGVDRQKVLDYALSRVGEKYGFLTIISIALNILTPRAIRVDFRRSGTVICSALGALALLCGGWLYPVADYYQFWPKQVANALGG